MDGSINNYKVAGQLFRPVTLSVALESFPPMIYEMICRKTYIDLHKSAAGIFSVVVYGREERFWTLRTEDYEKCLNIVRKFTNPLVFPPSLEITFEIIKSYIRVEFAGRV